MKVLVIGANGQDGRIISDRLKSNGHQVIGVTSPSSRKSVGKDNVFNIDLSVSSLANDFLTKFQPRIIFHVAAVHGSSVTLNNVVADRRGEMFKCHVEITQNLLNWIRKHSQSRLHVALSSQMYSTSGSMTKINESSPTNPQNFYGQTKLEAWELIKEHRKNFGVSANASILFNHSSEYSSSQFLFPTLVTKLIESNFADISELQLSNPNSLIDITDAVEICDAIIKSVNLTPTEDYVLGSGKQISLSDLVGEINQKFKTCEIIKKVELGDLTGEIPAVLMSDIAKAKMNLDWCPKNSPVELLDRMIKMRLKEIAINV